MRIVSNRVTRRRVFRSELDIGGLLDCCQSAGGSALTLRSDFGSRLSSFYNKSQKYNRRKGSQPLCRRPSQYHRQNSLAPRQRALSLEELRGRETKIYRPDEQISEVQVASQRAAGGKQVPDGNDDQRGEEDSHARGIRRKDEMLGKGETAVRLKDSRKGRQKRHLSEEHKVDVGLQEIGNRVWVVSRNGMETCEHNRGRGDGNYDTEKRERSEIPLSPPLDIIECNPPRPYE
jgi:hypothetical protein